VSKRQNAYPDAVFCAYHLFWPERALQSTAPSALIALIRTFLGLACIAHKSLEICERCRLWQQNSPATPENSAAFWRGELKNSLLRFIYFKTGS